VPAATRTHAQPRAQLLLALGNRGWLELAEVTLGGELDRAHDLREPRVRHQRGAQRLELHTAAYGALLARPRGERGVGACGFLSAHAVGRGEGCCAGDGGDGVDTR
jgi:hypothetical protein